MKKYIIPTLKSSVIGIVFYSYLMSLNKITYLESHSSSWITTTTILGALFGVFTTVTIYSAAFVTKLAYKNKYSNHKSEVLAILLVLGIISLYAQVEFGRWILGYDTSILPIAYVLFGFLLPLFAAQFYSDDGLKEVEVIVVGKSITDSKDCVEHYNSGVVTNSLDELQRALKYYKTRHFILIDLTEEEVQNIFKTLAWTVADITYLYTKNKPNFSELSIYEWELSHSFEIREYSYLKIGSFYSRGY